MISVDDTGLKPRGFVNNDHSSMSHLVISRLNSQG